MTREHLAGVVVGHSARVEAAAAPEVPQPEAELLRPLSEYEELVGGVL